MISSFYNKIKYKIRLAGVFIVVLLVTSSYLLVYLFGFYGVRLVEFLLNTPIDINLRLLGLILMSTTAILAIFYIQTIHPLDPNLSHYEIARIQGRLMGQYVITPFVLAMLVLSLHWWYSKKVNYN